MKINTDFPPRGNAQPPLISGNVYLHEVSGEVYIYCAYSQILVSLADGCVWSSKDYGGTSAFGCWTDITEHVALASTSDAVMAPPCKEAA
jgi:hypothetical protein